MNKTTMQVLFWIPRLLCILFAMFLSMFALDVFKESQGLGETIPALLIHLIPTYIVIIALVIAWRWEGVGAIMFIALALYHLITSRGEGWIISAPLFIVGLLFLLNRKYKAQLNTR